MTDAEQGQVLTEDQAQTLIAEAIEKFKAEQAGAPRPLTEEPRISRWEERDKRRKANAAVAREAAQRRVERKLNIGLVERVEKARTRLNGVNVAGAIQLIQEASPTEYDHYLLAEKYGQARAGVLKQFGAGRKSVETAYLAEAGVAPLDQSEESVHGNQVPLRRADHRHVAQRCGCGLGRGPGTHRPGCAVRQGLRGGVQG